MEELDKKVIGLYQEMARGQGLTDSLLTELFARLFMEPEPIAMDELAKKTGYSLASVSNKIKLFGPVMQIKKIRKPGSKKMYLFMEKDIFSIWKDALVKKEEFVVNRVKEKMPSILQEYSIKVKTEKEKKKLKILESYYRQVMQFEKILNRMIVEFDKIK